MTTALAQAQTPQIRRYAQSLSPQECDKHRAWIGCRVEALLDPYWDKRPDEMTKVIILSDWMNAFEDYSPEEIQRACRNWHLGDKKNTKPKTGDIVDAMNFSRKINWKIEPQIFIPPPEPEKEAHTPDRKERINELVRGAFRFPEYSLKGEAE